MQFSYELRKIANSSNPPQKVRFEHWLVMVIVNSQFLIATNK